MLEKNGIPVLTSDDVESYNLGKVSERVKDTWGLSLDELEATLKTKQTIFVPKDIKDEKPGTPD